ncbi:alpha-amylase family glycosyl hydrolase [Corynebacterium diphtheriae]|nr:alpha-amylase family glycosyl hydrolase [Corynebacterium diphtheriae bv. mitis]
MPVREPVDPAPRLGTAEDWQSLVAACDERGIAVILNGVFSHVADVMRY